MEKQTALDLLNSLIDDFIDIYDINDTIKHLLYGGATKDDLLELDFDVSDIEIAIEEMKKLEEEESNE